MNKMKEVVIVSGVRLPIGSYGGSLKDISAIDMGSMVVAEAVKRAGIKPSDVDEVIIGQVGQIAENGFVAGPCKEIDGLRPPISKLKGFSKAFLKAR